VECLVLIPLADHLALTVVAVFHAVVGRIGVRWG
jgi:hypothetical protein